MTTYTFRGYRGSTSYTFTCPCCGRSNRKRTFTTEHTVNPYNRNADGTPKQATQVQREAYADAKRMRDDFATEPLCKSCEDNLTSTDRQALVRRRADTARHSGEVA